MECEELKLLCSSLIEKYLLPKDQCECECDGEIDYLSYCVAV